jgi:hypothetical protein
MSKEQYVRFPRQLLDSPVLDVININEFRALRRILQEHQRKSGFVNHGLVVTYRDFVRAGIHPKHVTSSLRVLVALDIIQCTRNMGGSESGRTPNMWKPTFLPSTPKLDDAGHDYLKIKTQEEAEAIADIHRFHEKRKGRMPQKHRPIRVSSPSMVTTNRATTKI